MILDAIIRTIIAYLLLLLFTRFIGRKMISQLTFFDYTVGVTLGTVTGSIALGSKYTSTTAGFVLFALMILTVLTGFFHIKSFNFRKYVNSEPVVIIENGKINNINMKRLRFTIDELMLQLRERGAFNISDIEFALLEIDGKLSVLKKSQNQPVTPGDLKLDTSYKGLMKDLIIDGEIMQENLTDAHLDETWLKTELEKNGVQDTKTVFYAGLDTSGKLYVSEKMEIRNEKEGKYGIE